MKADEQKPDRMEEEPNAEPDKVVKVAKEAAKGSLYIFAGNTSSTLILVITSIIMARLLGPSDYGLYSVAFIAPSVMLLFTDLGVDPALVRFTAKFKSEGESRSIGGLIRTGLLFKLAASTLILLFTFLLADVLAAHLLQRPEIGSLIRLSSIIILGSVLIATSSNIFNGLDRMDKTAFISVIQAVVKMLLAPTLIVLGFSVAGAITGQTLSALTAGLIGAMVALRMSKLPEYSSDNSQSFTSNLSLMFKYGMPLYTSTLITGLLGQFASLILARYTLNVEIGNYTIAQAFSAAVALITIPISTTLFPAFSKLDLKHEVKELKLIFKNSLKYTFLLVFPTVAFIAFNSKDLIALFYGSSYTQAPLYLTLHSITFLYAGFSLVLGGFLNGIGRTDISLKATLIRLPVVLLFVPALTWLYRIQGFIYALIIAGIPSLLYTAWTAHSQYGLDFGLKSIAKICVASLLSAAPALTLATFLPYSPLIKLALTAPLFILTYLTMAPLIGVIERQDLDNIALITKDIKHISKLIRIALSYEEKILSI